ncbi:MAG: hypothetical protein ACT4O6_15995 [Reyranella sp.]
MNRQTPRIEPAKAAPDAFPANRIVAEFILRGMDILARTQGDKLILGLIFTTIWQSQMDQRPAGPLAIRALARKLNLPYPTIRRHAMQLVQAGQCDLTQQGLSVPTAVKHRRSSVELLRRLYLNAERMLLALTRAKLARFCRPPSRPSRDVHLSQDQMTITVLATGLLLARVRTLHSYWDGDLVRALVFTAIWTGNVKHVTNADPAILRAILPDEMRRPISVLAVSNSLRLPYETVRRHANDLLKGGFCVRVGRKGLVVPTKTHHKLNSRDVAAYELVIVLLRDLRRAGVEV